MEGRVEVPRRQILTLGGVLALGAAVTGLPLQDAAAKSEASRPKAPCIGEPGYEERVARLFE